ncbi:hypothetical protein PRIPAC_72632 [Pristionchus pacificus]|uniref:Uncharacterized protein n=1 Tax=Pristionchus pacificus TaxID=54126 RepID=A0A2A6BEJ0_PRIPA|nr:hypothetical protein PRIPAC_72632 [Pristionchus pacificus]|eukprot:PDM64320.1 hypothetical protein PRIPAC_52576 [Pristionchus pacificus]
MPEYDQDLEAVFPLKDRRRSCCLAPCTCGKTTERMVSIHFFIILVASLQSFSVFLFAGTPRDDNGILTAYIGCALSLLPLPFLLFALYGIVYNRPNLILVLVVFLLFLIAMYIVLIVLDLQYELLSLPHFAFVLIAMSTLHAIHAIRVMLRQRAEMIDRALSYSHALSPSLTDEKAYGMGRVRIEGREGGMRLEKVTRAGRDICSMEKEGEDVLPFSTDVPTLDIANPHLRWLLSPPLFSFTNEQFALFHIRFSILAAHIQILSIYHGGYNPGALTAYLLPYFVCIILAPIPFHFSAGVALTTKKGLEFIGAFRFFFVAFSNYNYYLYSFGGSIRFLLALAYFFYLLQATRVMLRVVYDFRKIRETSGV